MIVYVPKRTKSKFAYYLYEIGRMMSNDGSSHLYSKKDCLHTFKSDDIWYSFDPNTAKVAQSQGITLPATEFIINNPVENDNWKLLGVFPTEHNSRFNTPHLFVKKDKIPSHYFTDSLTCEHCHKNLYRKQLWLFESKKDQDASIDATHTVHVAKGEFRMVGSTCIEVYTGFKANEIRKIQQLLDEAQSLGETSIDHFDAQAMLRGDGNYSKYSANDVLAMATAFADAYDVDGMIEGVEEIIRTPLNSTKPYDETIWAGVLPISDSARAKAQEIVDYFADPNNGFKLIKLESQFTDAKKYFDRFMDSGTINAYSSYNYNSAMSSLKEALKFYYDQPAPVDFSDDEKWMNAFKTQEGLPEGTKMTINAADIKGSLSKHRVVLESYDVITLPDNFEIYNGSLLCNHESISSIDVTITESKPFEGDGYYSRVTLSLVKESGSKRLDGAVTENIVSVTAVDGTPYKEPVKPNNSYPDYNQGDPISKDIEWARDSGNGWSEVLDPEGYLYAVYGSIPVNAKSFSALYGKHTSYKGTNKSTLSKVKFSDKTLAEMATPADTDDTPADNGPYLGQVNDEVVVDVKSIFKQATKGKFGDFFVYYIKDTAGHDIKVLSSKGDLIPDNVKLIKATIAKQEMYNNKPSTVLANKGLEVLELKD